MLGIGSDRNFPTVLLIDDDLISREVIATVLTLGGYTLHTAVDGTESLEMLDKGICAPEVILVDVQMPGLNGVALIKELRTRSAASIYAISGTAPPDDLKSAADGFLLKPFGPEALQSLLGKHTRKPDGTDAAPIEPVVSAVTLAQFREMMPEPVVRQVYAAVADDLKKRSILLEAAIAQGNAEEVRRIGHAIKGGCGMAGAREAARLGAMLESESDQLNNSKAVLRDLRTATQNLERMLEVEFPA
jgi:CheY-like chemotaxis protein/HPt (histidine-containing phosphotransfer) domain-containing protein